MLNAMSCSWKRDLVLEGNEHLSAVIEYRYSERTDAEISDRTLRPRSRLEEINSVILESRFVARPGDIPERALTGMMTSVSLQN